mgnify:CR=1 FL=1|tara:strand:+ start:4173 stop:5045 length:873 start_codon:yes stop_codon:yes gene_type:complete
MATNRLIVNERQRQLGNFLVGRLLPFKKKRQVGPFTFIDHMGPSETKAGAYIDVDQHPHIGLSTLTYLFDGAIEHRDSIGSVQNIQAGDVGFMTSGKGVTHTERTPMHLRNSGSHLMHGYQIWVALPKALEDMAPRFDFFAAHEIPSWQMGKCSLRLAAGTAFGKSSPLVGYSPLFMVDVYAQEETQLDLRNQLEGEVAFVVVKGCIEIDGETVEAGQMCISTTDNACSIHLQKDARVLLFGGEPLDDEPILSWNFVSSDREKLKQARLDWEARKFPKVPGDQTYIPFPK